MTTSAGHGAPVSPTLDRASDCQKLAAGHPRLLPEPTISGPQRITVGGTEYNIPKNAGVAYTCGSQIAYVLHQARLHCFVSTGELSIPASLRSRIASMHFGANRPPAQT